MSRNEAADPYWFYVSTPTELHGLEDYGTIIGRLMPGNWYGAKATYDEWIHAIDQTPGAEGWVAEHAVARHQA